MILPSLTLPPELQAVEPGWEVTFQDDGTLITGRVFDVRRDVATIVVMADTDAGEVPVGLSESDCTVLIVEDPADDEQVYVVLPRDVLAGQPPLLA